MSDTPGSKKQIQKPKVSVRGIHSTRQDILPGKPNFEGQNKNQT